MKEVSGRSIAALLNPRPIALITSCDAAGRANVLSVAWLTPVSHQPPILAVSIAPTRYSHELISASGEFVVNLVGPEFAQAVERCGECSGRAVDKFARAGLTAVASRSVRPPRIDGALACLECRVFQQVPSGDHTLFLASLLHAEVRPEAFSDVWLEGSGDVLLCLQRSLFGRAVSAAASEALP